MTLPYVGILAATVAQFIIGAIWYMPVFGNLWGKIHGMDKVPAEERKVMQKSMVPFLLIQLFFTLVTSVVLAIFVTYLPSSWNVYALAGFFWVGFVVPTQVSAVIFGGTEGKWVVKKILIMAGGSLLCLEAGAAIIKLLS